MPERYHVPVAPAPAKFRKIGKYASIDWREDCSRCKNCVKHRCVYGVYTGENAYNRDPNSPIQPLYDCRACLSCMQDCTKGLLTLAVNPEFQALGNGYWTPAILATTWEQAEAGKIPVSGAGYRGPLYGPGFDSMWTDMSEIVRPTRDGIHGREYISTSVDIGPRPMHLAFAADGSLAEAPAPLEVPIPAILDVEPWGSSRAMAEVRALAARKLGTIAVVEAEIASTLPKEVLANVAPLFTGAVDGALLSRVRMAEFAGEGLGKALKDAMAADTNAVLVARIPLSAGAADRMRELHEAGIRVFHLAATLNGCEVDGERFIKDALREIHGGLVRDGLRDETTIIASGGIALAEHMAKTIICGADLIAVGTPLLVALGCHVCFNGHVDGCGVTSKVEPKQATQRIVNLMGAWHSQLIEVLGAMGIREVRRLRGEVGRAMFLEDLEREAFSDLR